MLPDDVLLEIFDVYVNGRSDIETFKKSTEEWQILVHVCRRWRSVVFGSPRRLNLRLVCTQETPARDTLNVWPSLPLLIRDDSPLTEDVDEILAVLERGDRVVKIDLSSVNGSNLEPVLAAMQMPFPELTRLDLLLQEGMVSVLPDSFLGGSVPRLQYLRLSRTPCPGLPKLLMSALHLVDLHLWNVPHSGYISPEAMVTSLSTLTSLERLSLDFESPRSHPDRANRCLPPTTRSALPVLTVFWFKGACEYLEDIVTRIDAPRLNNLHITLFNQIVFDMPQFTQFISRSPTLETFEKALVVFMDRAAWVSLSPQTSDHGTLDMTIPCIESDWQVSSMEQVCTSCLPSLSTLEDLYIYERQYPQLVWKDSIENTLWLELLRPFTGVKNLHLSETFASLIIPALQELSGGRTTEVLPALQNIFLEEHQQLGTVKEGIQQFSAMRQVTGHPIAVSRWDNSKQDLIK